MKKHIALATVLLFSGIAAIGADSDPVLMNINGSDIHVSEFEYLYNKNNSQQIQPQTMDEYLQMFIDYKLKVADAIANGLDNTPDFKKEFSSFKSDLSKPYLRDTDLENKLIQEEYQRRLRHPRVHHIMMNPVQQSMVRLDSIKAEILSGKTTFAQAAEKFSIDRASAVKGGNMGFVATDRLPYKFAEAVYNLPIGALSPIIDSGMGYHLVYVDSVKDDPGQVQVEHILLITRGKSPEEEAAIKNRIDSLYNVAVSGADFSELARNYSQDPGSARNGGKLPWFGTGEMVAEFDSTSFALKDNEISKPIKTSYGYHIVHRIQGRPVASFEDMKKDIMDRIGSDERASMPEQAIRERMMKQKNAKLDESAFDKVQSMIAASPAGYDSTAIAQLADMDLIVATFDGGSVKLKNVMPLVPLTRNRDAKSARGMISGVAYSMLQQAVMDKVRDELALIQPEYRNLVNEYRDGILLYEISNKNVWDKAAKDTQGLNDYFKKNIKKYRWDSPRLKSYIIFATSDSLLSEALTYAKTLDSAQPTQFVQDMRKKFGREIKVERVIASKGENPITDYLAFGGDKAAADAKSSWKHYALFDNRLISQPEEATDVRGQAVTDYQAYLDSEWVKSLRKKYPVKVDKKVFKQVKENINK